MKLPRMCKIAARPLVGRELVLVRAGGGVRSREADTQTVISFMMSTGITKVLRLDYPGRYNVHLRAHSACCTVLAKMSLLYAIDATTCVCMPRNSKFATLVQTD